MRQNASSVIIFEFHTG